MEDLKNKADILRALCLISTTEASSGHPTSCLSAVDLMTVLFGRYFQYDIRNPKHKNNDRIVFSKGHAAPLLYSLFASSGAFKTKDLLSLRKLDSVLEGHPTTRFKFADASTGSLGQGLSIAAGIALNAKKENYSHKTYCLLGDGEIAEGQIYEAGNFSSFYKLDNLIVVADINNLGQTGETMYDYNFEHYENLFFSLGFATKVIDGHKLLEINKAFQEASQNHSGKPFIILAKTIKGKGVSFLENNSNLHGKVLSITDLDKALLELSINKDIINENLQLFELRKPEDVESPKNKIEDFTQIIKNNNISTREAFGEALLEIGINKNIYVFDGDVSNSTFTNKFKENYPDRFIECFIAEQNMIGVANGLSSQGKIPFIATFASFLTRGFDQIRMANISNAHMNFVGSHSGVSIGEDGPSQMGLEDISMFSVFPNSVILHPCDSVSCQKLVPKMIKRKGVNYLRTIRAKTKSIYNKNDDFKIGGCKILQKSNNDQLAIVASGITVFEALRAYNTLKKKGINVAVIDAYSIKPLDKKTIVERVDSCKKRVIITVEDHYINGGLGDILLSELNDANISVFKLGIREVPYSGTMKQLLKRFEIDSGAIIRKVIEICKQ